MFFLLFLLDDGGYRSGGPKTYGSSRILIRNTGVKAFTFIVSVLFFIIITEVINVILGGWEPGAGPGLRGVEPAHPGLRRGWGRGGRVTSRLCDAPGGRITLPPPHTTQPLDRENTLLQNHNS